jgi:hypothetical protein
MGRALEIVFPRRCATFQAHLLEGLAPRTCQAIWDVLPIETRLFILAGREKKYR